MEDPDVITRAQLAPAIWGRRNCRTGKHAKRTAESRGRGGYIGIYLYSGSYALHTHRIPRCALLWRIFWTVANRWKNMQRTTFYRNRRAIARLLRANVVRRVASHWFLTWLVSASERRSMGTAPAVDTLELKLKKKTANGSAYLRECFVKSRI